MRKLYFLLSFLFSYLALTTQSFAQTTITVPAANTSSGSVRQPLGTWYGFERSAMIYTSAEMGGLGGSITSVAFYVNAVLDPGDAVDARIYMKTRSDGFTAGTTYASEIAGATLVYGPVTIPAASFTAGSWHTITLTTPFPYTGGNLEVIVETSATGFGNEDFDGKQFRYNTQPSNSFFQIWNTDNAPSTGAGALSVNRPNAQFVLTVPPCAGPLNGGTTSAPASACPGNNFNLSVSDASFGTGITFQWQSSPDGTAWTDVPSATSAGLTTSQTAATYYRRKMTCSGVDGFSTAVQVGLSAFLDCYCNSGLTTTINGIDIVTNMSLTNAAGNSLTQASTSNGTTNFTSYNNTPLDIAQSTGVTLALTFGADGTQYSAAWIDYNRNGTFEASENVALATSSSGANATRTYNFTIPASSTLGLTRMRVRGGSDGAYTAAGACSNTSYGETEDYIVNIVAAPPCMIPTGLNVSAITTTTATIAWTAASPAPAAGYEWEVRTTGAPGSGATGLAASGLTGPGVVTGAVTGLLTNTQYAVYVRSVCAAGTLFSAWSPAVSFRTPCNPTTVFPFTETFETASPTRGCWKVDDFVNGTLPWAYGAGAGNGGPVTTAHGGALNAQFFGEGTSSVTRLVSPPLDMTSLTTSGADLTFWFSNASWIGDLNELRVYYKNSAAGTWTLLPGAVYTTNVGAWTQVEIQSLPNLSSDYYIAFEGSEYYGWGVSIDDVVVKASPSCRKVTAATAISTTPTDALVSFTSPGNAFIVEYGAPGFTPGTGNTAGTGGTIVLGGASPIAISGLTGSTTYDVYVRQICVPGVDYSENVKVTVTTLCPATNIPYLQNFETSVVPGMPACTSVQDVNGSSGPAPNAEGGQWVSMAGTSNQVYVSPTRSIRYLYDAANLARGADDWFFIQGLNLNGGTSYRLKFFYKASDGPTWTERLEVKYGTSAQASAMTNTIYTNNNIASALADPWDSVRVDFTPATTGVYYIGFHATSLPDQAFLYIDDISVRVAPVLDAGVTGLVDALPNCPTTNTVLKAVVRNYNIVPLNFATYPVTVTASITGAATTTLTTTVNTGTLAPGESIEVALPAYNFAAGLYNMSVATSSPSDGETGNDAYPVSFYVNPSPAVAVFTPADPRTCAQITTQFATPPPAPVTMPAVTSGAINLAIPDGNATGIRHTLTTSGVPAGAVLTGISVTLNASHTWNSDLRFNLKAPNGKILNLVNLRGGNGDNFTNTIISSTGTTVLPTANTTPVTGTFAADGVTGVGPVGYVSDVNNFAALYSIGNGDWTLIVNDNFTFDTGTLLSWSITLTYGIPHPVVTWSPATGLFTDAAGTVPYVAGSNAYSVYANPATTTTYTVTSTSSANCSSSSTVTVRPNAEITALPARICISDEVVPLNATPAGGTWTGIGVSGNTFVPPATAIGSYTLTYRSTSAGGCVSSASVVAKVVDCPERLTLLRDTAVILYPNPNTGIFSIRINSILYNKLSMRVYSASGTLAYSRELTGLAYGRVVPMDLTHLPGGHYLVQFYYPGGVRTSDKTFQVIIGR